MGSYCRTKITCNVDSDHGKKAIVDYANSLDDFRSSKIEDWCWEQFCESTKWRADNVLKLLSINFKDVIFRQDVTGEYNYVQFWMNGESLDYEDVMPKNPEFPSRPRFKKALDERAAKQEEAKLKKAAADAAAHQKLLEKQLAEAQETIKKTEASLAALKKRTA